MVPVAVLAPRRAWIIIRHEPAVHRLLELAITLELGGARRIVLAMTVPAFHGRKMLDVGKVHDRSVAALAALLTVHGPLEESEVDIRTALRALGRGRVEVTVEAPWADLYGLLLSHRGRRADTRPDQQGDSP
jgi:hypothetical protein